MADDVEVKLGADTSGMTKGTADAASSVQESLAKIAAALQNFGEKNKQVADKAIENNANLSRSFVELRGSVTGGFDAIAGVIERVRGVLGTLTGVLAGGMIGKEAVSGFVAFTTEVQNLSMTMGIASDQATALTVAMKAVGLAPETYTSAFVKFERQVLRNADGLKTLGVDIDSLKNGTKTTDEVFRESIGILEQYKEGHDRLQVAMQLFGTRGVGDVVALLKFYHQSLEDARKETEALGLTVTEQSIAMKTAYKQNLEGVSLVFEGLGKVIAEAVMPRITELAAWFREVGPAAVQIMRQAMQVFSTAMDAVGAVAKALWNVLVDSFNGIMKAIATVFGQGGEGMTAMTFFGNMLKVIEIAVVVFKTGILEAIELIRGGFEQLLATAQFVGTATGRALRGDFVGAAAAWTKYMADIRSIAAQHYAAMVKMGQEAATKIADIAVPGAAAGSGTPTKPKGGKSAPDFGDKSAADQSEMAGWENILKAAENAYNHLKLDQGSFETWSLEETRNYWALVLEYGDLSAKDRIAVQNKFYDADRKVQQEAFAAYIANLERQKAELGHNIDAKIVIEQKELDAIIQKYGKESKEAEAAYKRMADLRQQLADRNIRLAELERKAEEATANFAFNQAKTGAAQQLALREISVQQELALEQQYLDQKLALDRAAVQAQIDAMGPNDDPVKKAQLNAQLLTLDQQYQTEKTRIANQAELDRKQFAIQAANDVEAAFANTFSQLATSGQKWTDTLKQGVKSLADQLNQLFAQAIFKQLLGAGTQGGDFLNRIFGAAFGGGAADPAKAADTAAQTAHTTATTTDTTALTTNVAGLTTFDTGMTTTVGALTTFNAAIASTQAALASFQAQLSAGGGGGGLGSLFGGGGGGGFGGGDSGGDLFDLTGGLSGIAGFAVGTPYVPQDMIARVHKGEAIIPAKYNNGGNNTAVSQRNNFTYLLSGPVDMRTQMQINRRTIQAMRNTAKGGFA